MSPTSRRWLMPAILAIALALRLAALLLLEDSFLRNPQSDPDSYRQFAETLVAAGVYGMAPETPSAYRAPGYPLLLAALLSLNAYPFGLAVLHLVMTCVIIVGTARLAVMLGSTDCCWLAALFVALDPILIRQSALVMTETWFTMLFVLFLWRWMITICPAEGGDDRPNVRPASFIVAGLLLAAAALTRSTAWVAWLGLTVAATTRRRLFAPLVVLLVSLLVCLPWTVRNRLVLGEWIVTTTHGGYTVWLGQNPVYHEQVVVRGNETWPEASFAAWTRVNVENTKGMTETERDRFFRDEAVAWMKGNPWSALQTMGHHLFVFWSPAPRTGSLALRSACAGFYLAEFILAILGVIMLRRQALDLLLVLASVSVLHMVYWSDVRMRAPLMPLVAVLAAAGLTWLRHRGRTGRAVP